MQRTTSVQLSAWKFFPRDPKAPGAQTYFRASILHRQFPEPEYGTSAPVASVYNTRPFLGPGTVTGPIWPLLTRPSTRAAEQIRARAVLYKCGIIAVLVSVSSVTRWSRVFKCYRFEAIPLFSLSPCCLPPHFPFFSHNVLCTAAPYVRSFSRIPDFM